MSFYTVQKNTIMAHIKVNPNKNKNEITGIVNEELCLSIKAAPEKGKANKEIIRFLAKELNISRTEIVIKSGLTHKHKTIILPFTVLKQCKAYESKRPPAKTVH